MKCVSLGLSFHLHVVHFGKLPPNMDLLYFSIFIVIYILHSLQLSFIYIVQSSQVALYCKATALH